MSKNSFVEDIYILFASKILGNFFLVDSRDISVINDFYAKIANNENLTEAQGRYVIKLLKKYQLTLKNAGLDYVEALRNATWKNEFRILDLGKRIYIESDDGKNIQVCLKFPFSFRSTFDNEFLGKNSQNVSLKWDHNKRISRLNLYDINLISLYEFCQSYGFEIDDSFLQIMAQVEEIWDRQYEIMPYCIEKDQEILLVNAADDATAYWEQNKTSDLDKDLFLAKRMGFQLRNDSAKTGFLHKISETDTNHFWINDFSKFFSIYKKLDEKIVVILDSSNETLNWLEDFVKEADASFVPRSEIKICFREDTTLDNNNFNAWVKENKLGGKVDTGKIFIFRSKPAKWLFNNEISVNIVVTNNLFPPMNLTTQKWIASMPCVIFLGSILASQTKDKKIVQL